MQATRVTNVATPLFGQGRLLIGWSHGQGYVGLLRGEVERRVGEGEEGRDCTLVVLRRGLVVGDDDAFESDGSGDGEDTAGRN